MQTSLIFREEESSDDILGNNALLTTSSAIVDDRHARHCINDARFVPGHFLRRRLDDLGSQTD